MNQCPQGRLEGSWSQSSVQGTALPWARIRHLAQHRPSVLLLTPPVSVPRLRPSRLALDRAGRSEAGAGCLPSGSSQQGVSSQNHAGRTRRPAQRAKGPHSRTRKACLENSERQEANDTGRAAQQLRGHGKSEPGHKQWHPCAFTAGRSWGSDAGRLGLRRLRSLRLQR